MQAEKESSSASSWFLALIGAVVFGALGESWFGVLAGATLGYLLAQAFHLQSLSTRLAQRVRELELRDRSAAPAAATVPAKPAAAAPPVSAQPASAPAPAADATPPPRPKPRPRPKLEPAAPPQPSWIDRAGESLIDWFKRGNPLARAGIVVLFFGGAFLAKYAAEHSHFPIELRFIGIAAVAFGLLIAGWLLRGSRPAYAQTLQGGGIAGLYLTVFAATRLYQLLPPGLALGLMVVVALAAAVLAVAQNALALAVFGTTGGFLAPILVSTGSTNHVALFSYYAALNLTVFAVAWFRAWRVLNLIGFIFTFGVAGAFRITAYAPEKLLSTDFFVILFFLMYVTISVLFSLRQKADLKGYVSASLVFGLPLAAFGIHASLVSHIEYATAWSALGLGMFYLTLAWSLYHSARDNLRLLGEAFAALGLIFASLAVPLAFDAQITGATWAVEGAGLLWLGCRQQRRLARAFGALLQLLAGFSCYYGMQTLEAPGLLDPVLNRISFGCLMLAVSGLLSGLWLHRGKAHNAQYESGWDSVLGLWALFWWLLGGLGEVHRHLPPDRQPAAAALFLLLSALPLHFGGTRLSWPLLRIFGLALLPLAACAGLSAAFEDHHPLSGAMTWVWPALLAAQYLLLWREDRAAAEPRPAIGALHVATLWLAAALGAWELHWLASRNTDGVWADLPWGLVPAALLWPLSHTPLKPAWPLQRHADSYRRSAGSALAGVALLWVLLINLASDGDPQPLPYLPLLNPLDVSILLVFMLTSVWQMSLGATARNGVRAGPASGSRMVMAALVFLWLNGSLIRSLHYLADTPLRFEPAMHSTLVQAALSVFWSLAGFGAIVFGARRQRRELWAIGAGMMGVVVLKLFFVDFSGSTLARIVSSMVVGGLLLIAGYISPLPPRKPESEAAPAGE